MTATTGEIMDAKIVINAAPTTSTLLKFLAFLIFLITPPVIASSSENVEQQATRHVAKIILGAGCFWGVEKAYSQLPGVIDAVSGYADGHGVKPTYRAITSMANRMNPDNHAEVVEVTYNSNQITLSMLLQYYFEHHDPTQLNRQGNDTGSQYRSIILTTDRSQKAIAEVILNDYQKLLQQADRGKIVTQIKPLKSFYPAEDYHQDYLVKNPNGYCPDHSTGVRFANRSIVEVDNAALTRGLQVLVIEAQGYCPYCDKFKADVIDDYAGSIPITARTAGQLQGLTIKTPTWATPTIIFLRDGREAFGFQGYLSAKEFYRALGVFKLGNTEAYKVAFEEGTDTRYCRQYEIFKNTPDGVFVDKLSGAPLFDTRDRFNSKSGWLSFTKAIDRAVYDKPDNRYGMQRTEIRSASSDIHLGHVFSDGPDGMPRYCINATVLDFVPRGS